MEHAVHKLSLALPAQYGILFDCWDAAQKHESAQSGMTAN